MKKFIAAPKTQLVLTLLLVLLSLIIFNNSLEPLYLLFFCILSTVGSDFIYAKIRKINFVFPTAAVVSALIITLLVNPNLYWYQIMVIGLIAMFFKNFVRVSNRHIFNPAGIGLIIASLVFNTNVSWWGVSFQQLSTFSFQLLIPFFILLSPAFVSLIKLKRYRITFSFLITYVVINKFFNFQLSTFSLIFDPTVLFFSTVMLPEPMTSPNNHKRQIIFGSLVALLCFLPLIFDFIDPLILALLIGNAVFFKFR